MTFRDIRQGYAVYLFDRASLSVSQGKVTNVSQPRFAQPSIGQTTQMVVDVTVETDGQIRTYEIPESSSVVNASQLVLSVDRDGILREVEVVKSRSEEALKCVEKHRETVKSCDRILEEWNPEFAEKKKQDERIAGLEDKVDKMTEMLASFLAEHK